MVPHPKLPGTIHTAAAEIEKEGGQALPIEVDVRGASVRAVLQHQRDAREDADKVRHAMEAAAAHFGGIDILVNNASAINNARTGVLTAKALDLMLSVNVRGTYVATQVWW